MDRFKQIETFVAVAGKGSLTAAAALEGVAPAVIGRRIDALEARLNVRLMHRTTRRLTLTPEGQAFLEDCQRVLAELHGAEAAVSQGGAKASGHLRVTAPAGFGRRHVAPLVPGFLAQHPELRISLNLADRVIDLVNEGYDCAVRVGDLPDSSLISQRLADNRRLVVGSPDYLRRAGTPQHPRELLQHECLMLSSEASQTRGWAFRVDGQAVFHRQGLAGSTAATARCCTTGACAAWAWPGAASGRWRPTCRPGAWPACSTPLPRRPMASMRSRPSARCNPCACGCGLTICARITPGPSTGCGLAGDVLSR